MIKPTVLWNFAKTCPSDKVEMAGRVLLAVGGHDDIKLNDFEQMLVEMILNDSEWHDENCEKRRNAIRKAVSDCRARKKEVGDPQNTPTTPKRANSRKKGAASPSSGSDDKSPVPPPETPSESLGDPSTAILRPEEVGQPPETENSDGFEPIAYHPRQTSTVPVSRKRVAMLFSGLRQRTGKNDEVTNEEAEEEFWEYLVAADFRKQGGDGDCVISDETVKSTFSRWISNRRQSVRERKRREWERQQKIREEEERSDRISNNILKYHFED